MKGKKRTARIDQSKRQLLRAIVFTHNQADYPVSVESQIIIITRTFRILEKVWQRCGAEEVWNAVRSSERRARPPKEKRREKNNG